MKRPWQIWLLFALCLSVVLAAMAWVSLTALRLDCAEAQAQRRAALEEDVRLALWRMDSALTPLVARESARPYFTYSAFYPAERTYTRMFAEIEPGEVLMPSPMLTEEFKYILLHFQFEPDGLLSSPQVPTSNMRDLAEEGYTTPEKIQTAARLLGELAHRVDRDKLLALLPTPEPRPHVASAVSRRMVAARRGDYQSPQGQFQRNTLESQARIQSYQKAASPKARGGKMNMPQMDQILDERRFGTDVEGPVEMVEGVLYPVWCDEALLLVRRVSVNGKEYIQGCRLDWPKVREWLLGEVAELFPNADLRPAATAGIMRRLAALPVELLPRETPPVITDGISPVMVSLVIAWACVLLAAAAVAVLLKGAVSLSERRGAFVSAVTHELRTPLTTFRIYTDMLAEKMVPDEEKRKKYLQTLRTEAERLGHLVENVLAYARLERGRGRKRLEGVSLADLRERVRDRLTQRAEQANMQAVIEDGDAWDRVRVWADQSAVEQILFNLVDNACKYAVSAEDRRIHIRAGCEGRRATLSVCDHGPGIEAREARRLFRPFSKSSSEAANSAPGVGLGLALCRSLARDMGGKLRLESNIPEGACFVLSLKLR